MTADKSPCQTITGKPTNCSGCRDDQEEHSKNIWLDQDPALLVDGAAAASLSKTQLEKIMDRPPRNGAKFWRDQDPKTVELVRAGFKRLYPE